MISQELIKYLVNKFVIIFLIGVLSHTAEASGPVSLKRLSDIKKYNNGLQFYNIKKYDEAIREMSEYLEIYHDGIYRKEAFKNIAEIHFSKYDYISSLQYYRALYEEFSNAREGTEAFFNMGVCYFKMGYYESAKNIFQTILKKYTDPSIVQSAKTQLDLLDILN